MPLVLSVVRDDIVEQELRLGEDPVWIGRGASCHLAIDDSPRDERVASVRYWNGEYLLVDSGAERATVAGVALGAGAQRVIRPGDSIRVDGVELRFQRLDDVDAVQSTVVVARQDMPTITPNVVIVRVTEGPSLARELVVMPERSYVIGRDDRCDFVLEDADVSRRHVRVWRVSSSVLFEDLGSSNGTFLGARRIPGATPTEWDPWTMIRLGQSVMAIDL